jgi:hypothetical protein
MSDGKNLKGFNEDKPAGSSPWPTESYTEAPAAAFPASDVSNQPSAQGPK